MAAGIRNTYVSNSTVVTRMTVGSWTGDGSGVKVVSIPFNPKFVMVAMHNFAAGQRLGYDFRGDYNGKVLAATDAAGTNTLFTQGGGEPVPGNNISCYTTESKFSVGSEWNLAGKPYWYIAFGGGE